MTTVRCSMADERVVSSQTRLITALLLHDYAPFEANEEEEKRDAIASAAADPPPDGLVELGELLQQGGLE